MKHFAFLVSLALSLLQPLTAHQVDQHFLKIHLENNGFQGRLEMDAGYALPELREAEDDTLPTISWFKALPDSEKKRLLKEGKSYLKEVLAFHLDNKPLEYQLKLGKWGTDWPVYFDQSENETFQRMVWDVSATYGDSSGPLELNWNESQSGPTLALAVVSDGRELDLTSVYQGEEYSLAVVSSGQSTTTDHSPSLLRWLYLGFEHVIPLGLDHILFILGIFLLSPKWKPLLTQSLLFTLAHSITLGLTVAKVFPVNPGLIEPLIAASIAYIAIENLFFSEPKPWRLALIFSLGLLHGMGFGSVMSELPVNPSALLIPILGFNLGVEIAQITILAASLLLTFQWNQSPSYRWFRLAASLAIALTGLTWTLQRL